MAEERYKRMSDSGTSLPARLCEEEPLNDQVAKAIGWTYDPEHAGPYSRPGQYPWKDPDGQWMDSHPDYLHDKALAAGLIEKYQIEVQWISSPAGGRWCLLSSHGRLVLAADTALNAAVCRWVIAAKRAGIEVRQ